VGEKMENARRTYTSSNKSEVNRKKRISTAQ